MKQMNQMNQMKHSKQLKQTTDSIQEVKGGVLILTCKQSEDYLRGEAHKWVYVNDHEVIYRCRLDLTELQFEHRFKLV
jgi:hypothetical protein